MTDINTVNRMRDVFALLPSLKGEEFTLADIRIKVGVPNLSSRTLVRLAQQGYLTKVHESPGKPTVYTVRGF